MPEDMYGFTVAEREEFLRLAAKIRKLPESGLILPETIVNSSSPGIHLVKFPVAGIAPLDLNGWGVGTASGSAGADIPGSGICNVCTFAYNRGQTGYEIQPVTGYTLTALNITPSYIFEGYGYVTRERISGQWVITQPWMTRWEAKTTTTIASKSSGLVNIWINDLVSSPLWQVRAWLKWMNGTSTIAANKEILIDWNPYDRNTDGTLGKWIIHEREC